MVSKIWHQKLFCVMSTNGAGKTALMKELINRHMYFKIKIFKEENGNGIWDVIQNGSKESRTVIVGSYDSRAVCGGDLIRGQNIFKALRKAVKYPAPRILVESLKFHKKEIFDELVAFCNQHHLELNAILISADPIECHHRVLGRDEPKKYDASLIMERLIEAKYLWATVPSAHRFQIVNSNAKGLAVAAEELAEIVFQCK